MLSDLGLVVLSFVPYEGLLIDNIVFGDLILGKDTGYDQTRNDNNNITPSHALSTIYAAENKWILDAICS